MRVPVQKRQEYVRIGWWSLINMPTERGLTLPFSNIIAANYTVYINRVSTLCEFYTCSN